MSLWVPTAAACDCGPSFVREVRDPILLEIWRNALEVLREADRWIVV